MRNVLSVSLPEQMAKELSGFAKATEEETKVTF